MDNAWLEKLNAYLVSKGKPPKTLNQNFLKANASNVKKLSKQKKLKLSQTKYVSLYSAKKTKKLPSSIPNVSKSPLSSKENLMHSKEKNSRKSDSTKKIPQLSPQKNGLKFGTPKRNLGCQTPKSSLAVAAKKKLVRRSMLSCHNAAQTNGSASKSLIKPAKPFLPKHSFTPKNDTSKKKLYACTEKVVRTQAIVTKQKSKTPHYKRSAAEKEKEQRLDQLRAWMVAKGKDPSTLCGFKPAKVVQTPVNSPAKDDTLSTQVTQWPSLREVDFCDELSVLVNQTMKEAQACIEKERVLTNVHKHLLDFKEKVPIAEKHASFWLTLALLYQKQQKPVNDIIALYGKAIGLHAMPIEDVKRALKEFVEAQIDKPYTPSEDFNSLRKNSEKHSESAACSNRRIESLVKVPPPTPITVPLSPLVTAETPSSVIKLRMVPRSSPIFRKMIAKKALPMDINGIVTPVRRSKRIENLKWNYPKGLIDQETCVTSALDLVEDGENSDNLSKEYVFDPNKALGEDYSDISKVLQF